jgi:hypothetical protein
LGRHANGGGDAPSKKGRGRELDGDVRYEVTSVRGRTFPCTTYYDGDTDIFGWNGTAMVIEAFVAPPNAVYVGSHLGPRPSRTSATTAMRA